MGRLPLILTVASIVPFVVLSVMVSMRLFPDYRTVTEVLLTYAAVIISFLGGIHWGLGVAQSTRNRRIANLLIAESVLPALIAWGVLLSFHQQIHIKLLVMTLLYVFVWAIDSLLYNNDMVPQWFFTLRCIVTPIVVVSLYVAYFGLV
jgi:uncharacterized membrane protein YhdT